MEFRIADTFTDSLAKLTVQDDFALGHGFHEVDFLPENDRVRYTVSPEACKTILRRLLLLNHERYAEEQARDVSTASGV